MVDTAAGKTATATTTALEVTPASPVAAGTTKTLTATVAPSAAGSVQFTEGIANIGSAVAISGGTTTFTTTLPSGTHSLTAVFTPANPGAFGPSTSSPVSLTVQPLLSWLRVTGTRLRYPALMPTPELLPGSLARACCHR